MLKIRKRSGEEVLFDRSKIERAIEKANASVSIPERLDRDIIAGIALSIENACSNMKTIPTVESVQDMVEYAIAKAGAYRLAKNYAVYRYQHELMRKANTTDDKILAILHRSSADAKEENSNKNPDIVSTQRDYIAGEVNRDLTRRLILPAEITAAHDEGRIHFHDTDYSAQPIHNCDLVNLEDMLQNGTVITGTLIEKPHSFSTACNIATQIIAQIASSQYGGQTITLCGGQPSKIPHCCKGRIDAGRDSGIRGPNQSDCRGACKGGCEKGSPNHSVSSGDADDDQRTGSVYLGLYVSQRMR